MAEANSNFNVLNLDRAIRQVEMKLARQTSAIADTEAHLAALKELGQKNRK